MNSARIEGQSVKVAAAGHDLATTWQAAASPGGLIGVLGIVLSLVLAGATLAQVTGHAALPIPPGLAWGLLVVFVAFVVLLAVLVYGYVSIRYEFSREALTIRWAWQRYDIDLASIQQILPAVDRLGDTPSRWRRFWTGYYVGTEAGLAGSLTIVATLPVRRQLLIVTRDHQYAISPERPVLFVEEYERLRRALDDGDLNTTPEDFATESIERLAQAGWTMQYPVVSGSSGAATESAGAVVEQSNGTSRTSKDRRRALSKATARPHVLNDPVALKLLGITVLMNVAMVVLILVRYHNLPTSIALHWNVNGDPDRIGSPREIWVIPIITALVAIANLILAWSIETFDRFAARFLLAASCLVQVVAWVALITLMR